MNLLFSIVIPTYNRAVLIIETIESVLQQTYPHFEIIIVDDESTDNTTVVIEVLVKKDNRIKYYRKQNEERGAARNFGLKCATGDYAVFLDSDDLMKPNYLYLINSTIQTNPKIIFLAAKFNFLTSDNKKRYIENGIKTGFHDKTPFLKGNALACNYCIRIKNFAYKQFPNDRELASIEDWLFLLANLELTDIYIIDEIVLTMRDHDQRSMTNNSKVINARKKAIIWASTNLVLTMKEFIKLKAWSYYYCGIHEYLEDNKSKAIKEILIAMRLDGINLKFFTLFVKAIIGRPIIQTLFNRK
jgi:glycosyltransferase involved in cell wall biosynthesis